MIKLKESRMKEERKIFETEMSEHKRNGTLCASTHTNSHMAQPVRMRAMIYEAELSGI